MGAALVDGFATQLLATPLFLFAAWHVLVALFFAFLVPCTDGKSQADADAAMHRAMMLVAIDLGVVVVYSLLDVFLAGTPGKRMSYLQIRNADGSPAAIPQLLVRWACRNAGLVAYLIVVLIAFGSGDGLDSPGPAVLMWVARLVSVLTVAGFLMALGPDGLALHDRIAGTNVFRVDQADDSNEVGADETRSSAERSAAEIGEFGILRDLVDRNDDDLDEIEILEDE